MVGTLGFKPRPDVLFCWLSVLQTHGVRYRVVRIQRRAFFALNGHVFVVGGDDIARRSCCRKQHRHQDCCNVLNHFLFLWLMYTSIIYESVLLESVVRTTRFELAHLSALASKTSMSTNSTTFAILTTRY